MEFKNPWGHTSPVGSRATDIKARDKLLFSGSEQSGEHEILATTVLTKQAIQQNPPVTWKRYTVKNGEGFDVIANNFGISGGGEYLAYWNNMDYTNPSLPQVGDILALPYIDDAYLDEIEEELDEMIVTAEKEGWLVAVDNLNRFRNGTGGIKTMDVEWLKGFEEVQEAIATIQEHFEDAFNDLADDMDDGEKISGDGRSKAPGNQFWWEGVISPSYVFSRNELSYACGASTLTGLGVNTLERSDSLVTVSGEVEFQFYDEYDWHGGNSVPNGFFSTFDDSDMLLLQEFRNAKPFTMKASWKQKVAGTIDDDILSPNDVEITWTDI